MKYLLPLLLALVACKTPPPAPASPVLPPGSLLPNLTPEQRALAERGKALFGKRYTVAEGLGPYFNHPACGDCHDKPASGGHGDLQHVARNTVVDGDVGGVQFNAIPGFAPLTVKPGAAVTLPTPPPLYGLGLLEAIDETMLEKSCGNHPPDGVHGIANVNAGVKRLSRFGLKGHAVTVRDFAANALNLEMGMTNPYERDARLAKDADNVPDPEVPAADVDAIVAYVKALAPPSPPPPDTKGEQAFAALGCAHCHRPETGPQARAYTDLCLHDMGPEFDNKMQDFKATGTMWRTRPLWGLRWRDLYLHDGRTQDLATAIRVHGGEATAARDRFDKLPQAERDAFLAWLRTL